MPFSEIGHLTKENMPQSSTSLRRVVKVDFYVPIVVVNENRAVDVGEVVDGTSSLGFHWLSTFMWSSMGIDIQESVFALLVNM